MIEEPEAKLRRLLRIPPTHHVIELGGYRSVGGIPASIYDAMPVEGVRALRSFMDGFRAAIP